MNKPHQVVVLGGGFGGLSAVHALRSAPVGVTLVDRCNYHLFQPLLYQVATGSLSPANIAAPLRGILKRQKNARVLLGEAAGLDATGRRLLLKDGELPYDTLIVATGAQDNYFGHDDWGTFAPGLKSIEDATLMRRRIFLAFEAAERETDAARERAWLTFAIVGAGPTGVELAGALSEIAHDTLKRDFRRINPSDARIILIEAADRVLPPYASDSSASAARALERLDVRIRTGTTVTCVREDSITVQEHGRSEVIPARTVLWAAGVKGSSFGKTLAEATGCEIDRSGRPVVQPDLTLKGHPEVFVIGDLAHFGHQAGDHRRPLPGVAQVAIQQGRYAAAAIQAHLGGREISPFNYHDRGSMATIGRAAAVVELPWLRFSGLLAWLAWLFIHLLNIVEFQNRLLVLVQWASSYITFNRSARLITGENPFPLDL
jgi:NADH:ubiquinone reductase (H+-translocating)